MKITIIINIIIIIIITKIIKIREFTFTPLSDLTLLGASVTTGAALDKILEAKTDDLAKAIQRLSYLHAHDALTLIRHSFSVPKLQYVQRN